MGSRAAPAIPGIARDDGTFQGMRTFIIIVGILLLCVAAVAVYLVATTPHGSVRLAFPLTQRQQDLLARVPATADEYAYIASPAALIRRLETHPLTRESMARWAEEQPLPPPILLGGSDAAVWRTDKRVSYAVRFDPVRAWIAHLWTVFAHAETEWSGPILVINPTSDPPATLVAPEELRMTAGLDPGDALIVQRRGGRGAFPPIARPAVTSVNITARAIDLMSRASADEKQNNITQPASVATLPRSAMLAVAFTDPPRVLGDVDRLVVADVDALAERGGTIAVYDVDTGTLLPRPFGVIAVPASDRAREIVGRYSGALAFVGEHQELGGRMVVAFDRGSGGRYATDQQDPMPWPANEWSLRADPKRLVPILRKMGDNPALRFATPRIHRGARDLRRWMGALENADRIEAAASVNGPFEELRVRVAKK